MLPDWRHLALSLAFIPHLDPLGRPFPLLPPGWTLSYETVFYLIVAAAIPIAKPWRFWAVTAALTAIVAAGIFLADPVYTLGANPMLLEFAAGLWLGQRLEQGRLASRAWAGCLVGLGLAAFAILDITGFVDELWRPLLWGAPAALIVAGALSLEARGAVIRSRPLTILGDASYATYLVHLPATAVIAHTLGYAEPWLFIPAAGGRFAGRRPHGPRLGGEAAAGGFAAPATGCGAAAGQSGRSGVTDSLCPAAIRSLHRDSGGTR